MASHSKSRRAREAANQPAKKAASAPARRHHARLNLDPEQSTRLMLIAAVVGIVALALGIIGFGYWYSVVKPRNRTVLQIEDVKVSYSAVKRRMAYELFTNQAYQQQPAALPDAVMQMLTNEIIIDLKAESDQGVTITDEEFNQRLNSALGLGSSGDSKAFAEAMRRQLESSGLTDSEFRRKIRVELLTTKLTTKFTSEVPASAMQAKVDVIETETEAEAQKAAERVKAGEDWATVAKEVSTETGVATTGGIHDYSPQGTFDEAYDSLAFTTNVGEVSAPVAGPSGNYFLIRVEDRADKPITESQKPQMATRAFLDWIDRMKNELTIRQDFDQKSQEDAFLSIRDDVTKKLIDQAEEQQRQQEQAPQPVVQPTAEAQPTTEAQPTAAAGDQSPAPQAPTPGGGNGQ